MASIPRRVADPVDPPTQPICDLVALDRSVAEFGPTLSLADFRWSKYYAHPTHSALAVVIRFDTVVAVLPKRSLRFLRHTFLQRWSRQFGQWLFTEADIAAHIVDWLHRNRRLPATSELPEPQMLFAGHDHVLPEWLGPWDASRSRPASLTTSRSGSLYAWDPATSAFASVLKFGAPLCVAAFKEAFIDHPYGVWMLASVLFGFALLAYTPSYGRKMRDSLHAAGANASSVRVAFEKEVTAKAVVRFPPCTPHFIARIAPFFSVPKSDGGVRGISDMSAGICSTNSSTRRMTFSRLRLAKLYRIVERINYMKAARPGCKVLLAKMDVSRAFRQFPSPVRDFVKTAHLFDGELWANTRLMMGATASADSMATVVAACRDHIADKFGWFSESYIDDWMLVIYEDEAEEALSYCRNLWSRLGIPENRTKFDEEGFPATERVFLGVTVNTESCTLAVDPTRAERLIGTIDEWVASGRQRSPGEYAKLAGKLSFCAALLTCGRSFLQPLFYHACFVRRGGDLFGDAAPTLSLPDDVVSSLQWWRFMLNHKLPTVSFQPEREATVLNVFTDASSYGYGAVAPCLKEYLGGPWKPVEQSSASSTKWEMAAILFAISVWAPRILDGVLIVHSDSASCVSIFRKRRARNERLSIMLRLITILQMVFRFQLVVVHLPGCLNYAADFLSRDWVPPPPCVSWTPRGLLPAIRELGCSLLQQPPSAPSLDPRAILPLLLGRGSCTIARTLDIASLPILPWMTSKLQPTESFLRVGCSTFADGSSHRVSIPPLARSLATSQRFVSAVTSSADGNSFSPLCCLNSSCVLVNTLARNDSVTPLPVNC